MKLTTWAIQDAVVAGDLRAVVEIFAEAFPELHARLDEKWVAEAIKWTPYARLVVPGYSYMYAFRNIWALSAGDFHRDPLTFPPKENTIYFPGAWRQPA
jgi:hypothetical protein